ncbi:MAG TPA: acyl-CoA dehydrogenase family protein [Steroidobacteraceae bacterium]|nr:acyl-CoA dehydrogenase family protein [Steroidobacteraceae bacterium]
MDFALSEEQVMLRDGAERYLTEHYSFDQRRKLLDRGGGFSESHWRQFADLGWLALALPEDCGGLGGSLVDVSLILEAMGKFLVVEPFATTTILCAHLIDACGDRRLRADLLAAIASGDMRLVLAHGEEGTRYDLAAVSTRARTSTGQFDSTGHELSGQFVLSGRKICVWDAPSAHQLIVSAAIEGGSGLALFIVERAAPGLTFHEYRLIDGTQCADVDLQSVPGTLLLAGPEAAHRLDEAADRMVLVRVAEALGIMEQVLDLTAEYLRNRSQFGQPLVRFQALQHRLAEMFVEVQEVRSVLYRGLAYIEAPEPARRAAVSAAKVVASSAGRIVGGQGIQLHGGVGMTDEYVVGHYFKRLLAIEKSFGDTDYHLKRLASTYRDSHDQN